jgi:RimJ/RimL family protein N-acetyltransferase
MGLGSGVETIRTARLELAPLPASLAADLAAGDVRTAQRAIGARIGCWLATDPSHVVQLALAERAGAAAGFAGLGRVIVLNQPTARRVIGTIGFHGPPDELGRLEIGCRIHPAHRGRGYAAEAMAGLLDWATDRFGVTRFVVAVPSGREPGDGVPVEIGAGPVVSLDKRIHGALERRRP